MAEDADVLASADHSDDVDGFWNAWNETGLWRSRWVSQQTIPAYRAFVCQSVDKCSIVKSFPLKSIILKTEDIKLGSREVLVMGGD